MTRDRRIWTVGHSNLPFEILLSMLQNESIDFLVDVRSNPYSKYVSHFDREAIAPSLDSHGIRYVFMGDSLGGRPAREDQIDLEGHALYGPMSEERAFIAAIQRLIHGAGEFRIAIMCSCGNPESCHRRRLVGKVLCEQGVELQHIQRDGTVWSESEVDLHDAHQMSMLSTDSSWRSVNPVGKRDRQPIHA